MRFPLPLGSLERSYTVPLTLASTHSHTHSLFTSKAPLTGKTSANRLFAFEMRNGLPSREIATTTTTTLPRASTFKPEESSSTASRPSRRRRSAPDVRRPEVQTSVNSAPFSTLVSPVSKIRCWCPEPTESGRSFNSLDR